MTFGMTPVAPGRPVGFSMEAGVSADDSGRARNACVR